MSFSHYLDFAHTLADISGERLRFYYRNFGLVQTKTDESPVTIADQETEDLLRHHIKTHYPEHGIIGEEHGNTNEKNDYVWVLDPIDGTASYIVGRPIFGTLISLLYKGEPILGIIDQPILRERWAASKGEGVRLNHNVTSARKCPSLNEAVLCTTGPQYFTPAQKNIFDRISAKAKQVTYGGDCYNYALLASGTVDIVIEAGLKLHDFAALKVIVEEAGGTISDWRGNSLSASSDGTILATCDAKLHQSILTQL
jgi:histidinol phosphatase-like enzyme (inositol monophosphatase family)